VSNIELLSTKTNEMTHSAQSAPGTDCEAAGEAARSRTVRANRETPGLHREIGTGSLVALAGPGPLDE
jgi:hypothetical protein